MNRIQKIAAFGRPGSGKTFFSLKLISLYILSTDTSLFQIGWKERIQSLRKSNNRL